MEYPLGTCRACGAKKGKPCKTPTGRVRKELHEGRTFETRRDPKYLSQTVRLPAVPRWQAREIASGLRKQSGWHGDQMRDTTAHVIDQLAAQIDKL